jgi:hypothetical protein
LEPLRGNDAHQDIVYKINAIAHVECSRAVWGKKQGGLRHPIGCAA